MKKYLYRFLSCALLVVATSTTSVYAENGIIETRMYTICPGDTIKMDTRQTVVHHDTILYDTIIVTNPLQDSIYKYVVNTYPAFEKEEFRDIESGTSFEWRGLTITKAGRYLRVYKSQNGCDSTYILNVTEQQTMPEKEVTFTLCDGESVTFNGVIYTNPGTYYADYTPDSTYKITVVKYASKVYMTTATFDGLHPYLWRLNEKIDSVITKAGVYEHKVRNDENGCSDTYRLVLTLDTTAYHFIERATICENEEFNWHNLTNLNRQAIGETTHYFDRYRTADDLKDSIYELILTVYPVPRTIATIPFCESIVWKGKTYTESTMLVDTLRSIAFSCDSIITTYLSKGISFRHHDTTTITLGETLEWHGLSITTAGLYEDKHRSSFGCDSIYTIGVGVIDAHPQAKIRKVRKTICEGEDFIWRGKTFWREGTYIDTIFTPTKDIDSLYVLELTVNPTYAFTERVTFPVFPTTYRNTPIPGPGTYPITYTSSLGCDSIITVMVDREVIRDIQTVTICPGEVYVWRGHIYQESYQYKEVEKDINGIDSVEHILNLTVRYIPETRITKTICSGSSVTFGDKTLSQSGVYRHVFNADGCDSTVVLSLNVINPDTVKYVHNMREGETFTWHGKEYTETGVDYYSTTNISGCDSIEMLILTVNHVDTIDTVAVICPNETIVWHGITARQTGKFTGVETQPDGSVHYYRLDLTVRELQEKKVSFTICGDESISYNGKTYDRPGYFYDKLGCDTLVEIHITQNPQQVYETRARLGGNHGYTWTYWDNGTEQTRVFNDAGTFEYESPNPETGCSDIWRLILTKDETSYHFVETLEICEGDDFTWHGLTNLSRQVGTSRYYDKYQTRTGQDSIYELVLTVLPTLRSVRTITFCGSTTWKGKVYNQSAVVYDTLVSNMYGCDSIVRINLDKTTGFYQHDTATIVQGEVLRWHGIDINTDGLYRDAYTNMYGCDSIYEIGVGLIAATPQTNLYTTVWSICSGDVYTWRGHDYMTGGTYIDTVWDSGRENVDSIFALNLTVWPSNLDTIIQHLYQCQDGSYIRYNGKDYYENETIITNFRTIHGCDSVVKTIMHFNEALYLEETDTIVNTDLPYTWTYKVYDPVRHDTVLTHAGSYTHKITADGGCMNEEHLQLIVLPTYLYELDTTICEMDLPFYWLNGPTEHVGDALQHKVGTTKQYEYHYASVYKTDSIYRLNLTIEAAPKRVETHNVCLGAPQLINGKWYGKPDMPVDTLIRDTNRIQNPGACDSIIYYEIYVATPGETFEVAILHPDSFVEWKGERYNTAQEIIKLDSIDPSTGCKIKETLRIVQDMRETVYICSNDTAEGTGAQRKYPYLWEHPYGADPDTIYTSGLWTDTVFDAEGFISQFYSLDLTITQPYDTTIYVHGCDNKGAVWRDEMFDKDTTFIKRVETEPFDPKNPCDSVFHVHIIMDTTYVINIVDTICQNDLPYILGRQDPDTIWEEVVRRPHRDTTALGCDSIINLTLRIIPELTKSDSTFVCEDYFINGGFVYLGDTVTPWFEYREGGKYSGQWRGKWHGVRYAQDTIVYNCDSSYFHHIIVRPHQAHIPDTTYSICKGDSVQLFWPHDTTWISKPGVYYDTVPTISSWYDMTHSTTIHNDRAYACDSVTRWTIIYADTLHEHLYAHIREGETYLFNDSILSTTGVYDSIAEYNNINGRTEMDSAHNYCKAVYSLHLFVEPVTRYHDTIEICHIANREYTYTFDDEHEIKFQTPDVDTMKIDLADSTQHLSYEFYDHYYYLTVYYKQQYFTQIKDTICEGAEYRFDIHRDNATIERWLDTEGTYRDTMVAWNGCDSIVELRLRVLYRNVANYDTVMITDREIPYLWTHTWTENGLPKDSTDTLRASGDYIFVMPSIHGCDSVDSLHFTVHQTHVFRDTIDVCNQINKTLQHTWSTGYVQKYTTPLADDSIEYADTLQTRIKFDSIYVLLVNFHRTYETHIYDTICAGDSAQINTYLSTSLPKRFYKETGIYHDTVPTFYGCDSVITLHLQVWPGFPLTIRRADIADVDTPYIWKHTWWEKGQLQTANDSLYIAGGYSRVLPNIHGCDSVDSLTLYIHPTYHIADDTINICERETPYTWRGLDNISVTGDYEDGGQTVDGYDSIHYVHINVWKQTYDTVYATICEGDSMRWGMDKTTLAPRFVHTAGNHNDTTVNIHGCDHINVLNLTVHPRFYNELTVHIADVDTPYVWIHRNHKGDSIGVDSLYATDKYGYHFETKYACDSIDSLNFFVHNTYKFIEDLTICERETPYTWQNRNDITESGTYYYNPRTHDGYDSIYIATITVQPTAHEIITEKICKNNLPFNFHGTQLWKGGIYLDTLASTASACDSIVELHLTVNDPYYHYERHDIYEGETYNFFGETCTTGGTYTHSSTTPAGCDSITEMLLVVHPLIDTTATVCASDLPFAWINHWNGKTTLLHSAGIYHDDTTYVNGERTFWSIELIVKEPIFDTIRASICEGSSYPFVGKDIKVAGIYRDTTQGANGCDSITTLILTVNQPFYSLIKEDILDGQSVNFYGNTYTTTGTYTHYARTPEGCDSTTILQLTVHPLVDTIITVCDNELPVIWSNRWSGKQEQFYNAGLYRNDSIINGEKRFYGIQVNVNKQVFDTIRASICEGSSYPFVGKDIKVAGIYRDTTQGANGCDSITTLILTVNQPFYSLIKEDILDGQSVDFYGNTYTTTGTYTHYARTPEGCDSTTILQLTVHPLVDTIITVCDNELPVIWSNRWSGKQEQFYNAGLYRNDSIINGEKRFYGIQVNVNKQVFDTIRASICEGSEYRFNGKPMTVAGIYSDTLVAANGCDSIKTLILTVNKPYYNYKVEHVFEGQTVTFFGNTYSTTGTYYHYGTTPEGCDSTSVLQLIVHQWVDTTVTVCSTELPYLWINKWDGSVTPLYAAGTYRNDTTFYNGERMYYGLQLIVKQPTDTTIYREICEGSTYSFHGQALSESGEYRDTIRNTSGCDSIIILHLNVLPKFYHVIDRTIYEGDIVHFEGQTYSAAGTYPVRYQSSFGCDSIVELHLTVARLYDDSVSVCANDLPLAWRGQKIYESGVYRDTVTDTYGKTSVIGLKVTVLPIAKLEEPIIKTICEGDFYKFGDSILTKQGTYYDTLIAANGCDSIVTLVLQIQPSVYQTDVRRIFEGDSAFFNGVWYKESGVYEKRVVNEYGCTDTYQMILTVLKSFNVDTTAVICDSDLPFIWRGIEYNETGDYSLPIAWTDSSRVVKTLHLTVNKSFYGERTISICAGDTFLFKGRQYFDSGEFNDTIPSNNGCDSIIKYIIAMHPTFDKIFEKHISDKQPYDFHGRLLSQTGTYEWTGKTVNGCDSIEHLLLTVHPSFFQSDTIDLCQSDSINYPYVWQDENGRLIETISETGVYTDSVLTAYGFDSVHQLVVYVHPSYFVREQYEIGEGEVLKIHGENISEPKIYFDTLRTIHGCDSVFHIVVNRKRTREFTWSKTICQGDYYDFFGRKLTQTGQYKYTSQYKDSIVTLTLTVNPVTYSEKRIVITDKSTSYIGKDGKTYYTYIHDGKLYDSLQVGNNLFVEHEVNHYGCDSLARLIIVVSSHYSDWTPMPLCPGSEIKIDGDTIRQAGLYTFLRRSRVTGEMDSIWRVEVYDAPAYEFDLNTEMCDGDTLFIGNKAVTRGGQQDVVLKTVDGCDSIFHLDVKIHPSYRFETSATIFDYETYTWDQNHQTYNVSGVYEKSFPTKQDPDFSCDSTYVLKLNVITTKRVNTEFTLCEGQEYTWRGKTYTEEGFYTDTVANKASLQSAIYTLHLIVAHPTYISTATAGEICADDKNFQITFTYTGVKPTSYSIYYDQLAKDEGFVDVIDQPFLGEDHFATGDVPAKPEVIYLDHTAYIRPNKYTMSLVLDNGVCGISRADNIELTVKYPSWILEQNWNDIVVPLKQSLNGGYEFSQVDWFVNGVRQQNNGKGYLQHSFSDGDEVVMVATRKGENYSIETCPLVIGLQQNLSYDDPILVYPTQAPRARARVKVKVSRAGAYELYNATGILLSGGQLDSGENELLLPATCGIYFIRATQGDEVTSHKVLIY